MRNVLLVIALVFSTGTAFGDGMDEVNEWRRRSGLPVFIEDPAMTQFAAMKARYRAERNLRDGHRGPSAPAGWHEGTGEAQPMWGWLTCEMESDFKYAGAAMCVGVDGTRFMVLVCRGGSGRALIGRQGAPVHKTAYLTPNPPQAGAPTRYAAAKAPITTTVIEPSNITRPAGPQPKPFPECGKFH